MYLSASLIIYFLLKHSIFGFSIVFLNEGFRRVIRNGPKTAKPPPWVASLRPAFIIIYHTSCLRSPSRINLIRLWGRFLPPQAGCPLYSQDEKWCHFLYGQFQEKVWQNFGSPEWKKDRNLFLAVSFRSLLRKISSLKKFTSLEGVTHADIAELLTALINKGNRCT